jgi:hypothetical protein
MPWEPLNKELRKLLIIPQVLTRPRCGVFTLESSFFKSISDNIAKYSPECPRGIPHRVFSGLVGYLDDRFCAQRTSIVHGATWVAPGLDTITMNSEDGKLIGLHLDSWDGVSFADRDRSRTRLCVNMGPDVRSFLYAPIVSMRGGIGCPSVGDLIPGFLSAFPDFPIIRLNLLPGMGYFADTDNLIHDGSSALAQRPSMHFTMRGRLGKL